MKATFIAQEHLAREGILLDRLDWDAWLGPAPQEPYNPNRTLYRFRWFYDYSGGQVTNTGAHLRLVLSDASGTEIPADLRRRSPRAAQIAPGMRVHLRPEHASVFPAETA